MTKQILIEGINGSQAIFSQDNWEVTGSIPLSNSIINGYGYRAKFDFNDLKHIPLDTPILGYQIVNEDAEQQYAHIENDNLETVADLMMTTKQAVDFQLLKWLAHPLSENLISFVVLTYFYFH